MTLTIHGGPAEIEGVIPLVEANFKMIINLLIAVILNHKQN